MGTVAAAVDLLVGLSQAALEISTLVQGAQAAGRTTLTAEEWKSITDAADAAHTKLEGVLNG